MDDNGSSVNLMVFRESTLLLIARSGNYDEACKFKWSKIKALLAAGSEFIAENEDWLLNGGDYPALSVVYAKTLVPGSS